MLIEDGKGSGYKAEVNIEHMLKTKAIMETLGAHVSHYLGRAYIISTTDAGPVGGEYPFYLQNTSDDDCIIDVIWTSNVDANVVWKLHKVTGTAAGASVLTPINLNFTSGNVAELTARGGAGGVTGLTSSGVLHTWYGGAAYNTTVCDIPGLIVLGKNYAVALEYDSGTGGACAVTLICYYGI